MATKKNPICEKKNPQTNTCINNGRNSSTRLGARTSPKQWGTPRPGPGTCRSVRRAPLTYRPKAPSAGHVLGIPLQIKQLHLLLRGLAGGQPPRLGQDLVSKTGSVPTTLTPTLSSLSPGCPGGRREQAGSVFDCLRAVHLQTGCGAGGDSGLEWPTPAKGVSSRKGGGYVKIHKGGGLARWPSWPERRPTHQSVVGSIPGQGTCLGCRFDPWSGRVREATDLYFSLSNQ